MDNPEELRKGAFMVWVPLNKLMETGVLSLNTRSIICAVQKMNNEDDWYIRYKNGGGNRYFSLRWSKTAVFQELNASEITILNAIEEFQLQDDNI